MKQTQQHPAPAFQGCIIAVTLSVVFFWIPLLWIMGAFS
jgi:hypothetical protein